MLRSDFSRKAHANFQNYFSLYAMCFSSTLYVNIESNFHFSISIDVFNHSNATNIKEDYFRCVNKTILGV